jgi:hypothetical protein
MLRLMHAMMVHTKPTNAPPSPSDAMPPALYISPMLKLLQKKAEA